MRNMQRVIIGLILGGWCWVIATPVVLAQTDSGYQGNQAMHQLASLVAPDPDMEINIYPQPNTRKPRVGYGINGDAVTVVEQTGSNGGTTWNRIQFEGSPESAGWVQLEYLSIQPAHQQEQGNSSNPQPDTYLGNQSSSQDASSSRQQQYQSDQQRNYR